MRILVVDRSISGGMIKDASCSLFKHLGFWHLKYHQIDLLVRVDNSVSQKLKNKANLVKLPPRLFFFDLMFVYLYLIFKSRKYDLVIEVWQRKPNFRLLFNTRRSLAIILSDDFKFILPGKMFRFIYGNTKFLVNSHSVKDKLIKLGYKNGAVYYISDGIDSKKNTIQDMSLRKKNKILILCGKDIESVVSIVGLIERRNLDWKFVVLSEKKNIIKLKRSYDASGLTSSLKMISITDPVFDTNITNSKFLLITEGFNKTSSYISKAFSRGTPVFVEGSNRETISKGSKRIDDLIFVYDNKMDMAAKILTLTNNDSDYKKLQDKITKSTEVHTWDEVGNLSLRYIESL